MTSRIWNIAIGAAFTAFSLAALFWWIPSDVESGVVVEERRAVVIGDAMAPTMIAVASLIVGLALALSAVRRQVAGRPDEETETNVGLTPDNLVSLAVLAVILCVSMFLTVWGGPALVAIMKLAGSEVESYRHLSDTVPYKFTGFAVGGLILVFGLIVWVEGRPSWRAAGTAAGTVLVLILVYDLPFDTLLLPPNGNQ